MFILFALALCALPAAFALTLEPDKITDHPLRAGRVYTDDVLVETNVSKQVTLEILCGDDESCQWADLIVYDTASKSLNLNIPESNVSVFIIRVVIPEEVDLRSYHFRVEAVGSGESGELRYELAPKPEASWLEEGLAAVLKFLDRRPASLPNTPLENLTILHLVVAGIVLLLLSYGINAFRKQS